MSNPFVNLRLSVWLAGLLAFLPSVALAGLISFNFEFSSSSGPIIFTDSVGSFQYDDSIVPVGGGKLNQANLLTDLSVSFGGYSYDETTANTGWLDFFANGSFKEAFFGNNCSGGTCALESGKDNWWIRVGTPGTENIFSYIGYDPEHTQASTTSENMLIVTPVPEPGALVLLLIGLGALLVQHQRLRLREGTLGIIIPR